MQVSRVFDSGLINHATGHTNYPRLYFFLLPPGRKSFVSFSDLAWLVSDDVLRGCYLGQLGDIEWVTT